MSENTFPVSTTSTFPLVTNDNRFDALFDKDVVVVFADEVEKLRFIDRRPEAFGDKSKKPATYIFNPIFNPSHPWTDLDDDSRQILEKKQLTNRSIWVRTSGCEEEKGDFVEVLRCSRDHGGILFENAFYSELQSHVRRLDKAFELLGLRYWKYSVAETYDKTVKKNRMGSAEASVGIRGKLDKDGNYQKDADVDNSADANNSGETGQEKFSAAFGGKIAVRSNKFEHYHQEQKQDFKVDFGESRRDPVSPLVRKNIAALGLLDDQVVRKVLLARGDGRKVESITYKMDFKFTGEILDKFDIAFKFAAAIKFVSAKFESQYHSFVREVKKLTQSVDITISDTTIGD
ncbi:MAG: hypothetical protein IJQ73_06790 [Kiritimatiellae bacterium]|nr:hypothetical protein [Kiritimatiellia bacterium]